MTEVSATLPPIKRVGPLKTAGDAKALQARLLRLFIAGTINETFFKASTYGVNNLLNCIKTEYLVSPQQQPGMEVITKIVIGSTSGKSKEERMKVIDAMNEEIMDAPENW